MTSKMDSFKASDSGRRFLAATFSAILSVGLVSTSGCNPAPTTGEHEDETHDVDGQEHAGEVVRPDDLGIEIDSLPVIESRQMPETLDLAIKELADSHAAMREGFEKDDPESVHDDLHDVGGLLETLEQLVGDSDLSADDKTKAAKAVETLFDSYMEVDATLHGDKGKDYKEVSDGIDEAMEVLKGLLPPAK